MVSIKDDHLEPGCCATMSAKTVELCERMTCGGRAACEKHEGKCYFVEVEGADCTFATTTEPCGCCRAERVVLGQRKVRGTRGRDSVQKCDGCEWLVTDDPASAS